MSSSTHRDLGLWALAVIAVVLNAAISSYNIEQIVNTERTLQSTRASQTDWIELQSLLIDAETGHRGYIITSEPAYLEPYEQALRHLPDRTEQLRLRVESDPEQSQRYNRAQELIYQKFDEMKRVLDVYRSEGWQAAQNQMRLHKGKLIMDEFREVVKDALNKENQTLIARDSEADERLRLSRLSNFVALLLGIGIVVVAGAIVHHELKRRRQANEALSRTRDELQHSFEKVHESEALYRNLADRLELEVRQRTAAIEEQSRQLKTSNEELEKFAYIASHDLQEPLRKIQSFGDRLLKRQRDQLDADGRDSVDRMLDAAGRMRRLIEDLLSFSRVSTQSKPFEPVDLNRTLADVRSIFELRLQQAQAVLTIDPLPTLPGEPSQLRQLFQNLIGNALKFARTGVPPEIHITAESRDEGWRFEFQDNGIGFEPQYAERIFELFQRLHGRSQYEGTGLGLAICKKIVERHGATITAYGMPGQGARFVIDWPVPQPQEER